MKKLIGIFTMFMIAGFLIAWSSGVMDKAQKLPKVEQKIILIPGNKDMTPTGFTVHEKDQVTIKASGYIYFSDGKAQSKVDPDGWARSNYVADWGDNANFCDDPLMEENPAALIADVAGEKFPVGKEATFVGKAGLLYLGINDCTFTGDFYNTGQFSVVITIERGGGSQ
ncbi:MAG: hypothetical protein ACXW2O_08920 [Candidatus Aminicenantales bacterium]